VVNVYTILDDPMMTAEIRFRQRPTRILKNSEKKGEREGVKEIEREGEREEESFMVTAKDCKIFLISNVFKNPRRSMFTRIWMISRGPRYDSCKEMPLKYQRTLSLECRTNENKTCDWKFKIVEKIL